MCFLLGLAVCLASREAAIALSSLVQSAKYLMISISAASFVLSDNSTAGLLCSSTKSGRLGRRVFLVYTGGVYAAAMFLDIRVGRDT